MAQATRTIEQEFVETFDGSRQRAMQAMEIYPAGVTHDARYVKPFPIYIQRADGAIKVDVDNHELIDYAVGHGSLILGHNHPEVVEAVTAQLKRGTHFGSGHDQELEWGDWVQRLVPSAARVKFTSSGTEATMLAIRVARAFSGKEKILKFAGHFHGWHDYAVPGEKVPFDAPSSPGIPQSSYDLTIVAPHDDLNFVEAQLARGDIAAVILEPSGASWATIPPKPGFLHQLREITRKHDTILIFDEVITGFRWSPGGAQERFSIMPDMTTLAKIVAGGLPGGCIAGRADIMSVFEFRDEPGWKKIVHPGTYNANPLASVSGATCLRLVSDRTVQEHADAMATRLRAGFNAALVDRGIRGVCYGESSVFHVLLGVECSNMTAGDVRRPEGITHEALKAGLTGKIKSAFVSGMMLEGSDLTFGGGWLSLKHTPEHIDQTIAGFDRTIVRMRDEGVLAG
ncbi:MAG TPA: aspartate aminotransferase family protein [Thermomicrobiales bacterium]|nr:aspartate aminotransferase family protein [Thermomicrobiales bacterium]